MGLHPPDEPIHPHLRRGGGTPAQEVAGPDDVGDVDLLVAGPPIGGGGTYGSPHVVGENVQELEQGRYPAELGQTLAQFVEEFAVAWVKDPDHPNASKDAANKDGARHVLTILAGHARRRLTEGVERGGNTDPWPEVIDLISSAERQLYTNVNLKLVLENLVVQWAQAGSTRRMIADPF